MYIKYNMYVYCIIIISMLYIICMYIYKNKMYVYYIKYVYYIYIYTSQPESVTKMTSAEMQRS